MLRTRGRRYLRYQRWPGESDTYQILLSPRFSEAGALNHYSYFRE